MFRLRTAVLSSCLALFTLAPAAQAMTEEAQAHHIPWSGSWYPVREKKTGAKKGLIPYMHLYDMIVGNSQASKWEETSSRYKSTQQWTGHCDGWSAAAVSYPEPKRPLTTKLPNGKQLTLTVAAQKAFLVACHTGDDPGSNFYGQRSTTNDPSRPEFQDLLPDQLWRVLRLYIKQQGVPIIMDLDAGLAVWNYPVYRYHVEVTHTGGNQYRGKMSIWYAEDNVAADFVGVSTGVRHYQFVTAMKNGTTVPGSARWVGSSVRNHPDFAWYPYRVHPENPNIDVSRIRRLVGQVAKRGPGEPEERGSTLSLAPGTVTLSPEDLVTLLAQKRSTFDCKVAVDRPEGGKPKVGEACTMRAASRKAGYLHLFRLEKDGSVRLLFPRPGQDNRIAASDKLEGTALKDRLKIVCTEGENRIKAVVTPVPLSFTGVDYSEDEAEGFPLRLNPLAEEQVKSWMKDIVQGKKKAEQIEKETGVEIGQVVPGFAQHEVVFTVSSVEKKKPAVKP